MAALQPLFSSSSGNATLIEGKEGCFLVDAGVSGKSIASALEKLGYSVSDIRAVFITHEHSDHIGGVGTLARRYRMPVYANRKTWAAMRPQVGEIPNESVGFIEPGESITVCGTVVKAFPIPHDAASPVGYNFLTDGAKLTVATDIGKMDEALFLFVSGSREILLESNYDTVMLEKGSYPIVLKKRIRGEYGHLSNKEAAMVSARLASLGTKKIILGHLSKENNRPELAIDVVRHYIEQSGIVVGRDVSLSVAPRTQGE